MSHWTKNHYKQYDTHVWVTWDEAGMPMSVHATEDEAREALMAYAAILESDYEAVFGDHNLR